MPTVQFGQHRRRNMDDDTFINLDQCHQLSLEELNDVLWGPYRRGPRVDDWFLFKDARKWIAGLPRCVRPLHLQSSFPRIANELHRLWAAPHELEAYFRSLLWDQRPSRKGFPPLVREELEALHTFSQERRAGSCALHDLREAA